MTGQKQDSPELLSSLITELQDAGFVRQTTRQPNGSL